MVSSSRISTMPPDYLLDEMTGEEKEKLYQNDASAMDRGLKKAMEVLK